MKTGTELEHENVEPELTPNKKYWTCLVCGELYSTIDLAVECIDSHREGE